jgi:hypothetical protein
LLAHHEIEVDFHPRSAEQGDEQRHDVDVQRFGEAFDEDLPALVSRQRTVEQRIDHDVSPNEHGKINRMAQARMPLRASDIWHHPADQA